MKTKAAALVIFTAFANPKRDLVNLNQEQNGIQDALGSLEAEGKIKHVLRTDTDLTAYFDFLQRWKNKIFIFHYAGHADNEVLALQNVDTFFKPLAEELCARNASCLRLVFLNGCSTHSHVQTLFDLGVPAVIASSAAIDDNRAMQFAVRFYGNIARGDSIEGAYKSAANYIKGSSNEPRFRNLGEIRNWRSVDLRSSEKTSDFPWGLYVREEGVLLNEPLIEVSKMQEDFGDSAADTRRKCTWIWLPFTIFFTGLILAQTLTGFLENIILTAWVWLLVNVFPGLSLLIWSALRNRDSSKPLSRVVHRTVLWLTFIYQILVASTLLSEPNPPGGVSIKDLLLMSYIWLGPINLLIMTIYWKIFVRR